MCIGSIGPSGWYLQNISEATRTLTNLSTLNAVLPCSLNNQSFAYLTAAQRNLDLDYEADTISITTECAPVSRKCHLQSTYWCAFSTGCFADQ